MARSKLIETCLLGTDPVITSCCLVLCANKGPVCLHFLLVRRRSYLVFDSGQGTCRWNNKLNNPSSIKENQQGKLDWILGLIMVLLLLPERRLTVPSGSMANIDGFYIMGYNILWAILLLHQWFPSMVPSNGSHQWFPSMVPSNGSQQWFPAMVPSNGSHQWFPAMVPSNGSHPAGTLV